VKLLLIVGGVVAAVGLFLLATASGDTSLFARHYPLILLLNAALAGLLAGLVAFQLLAMARRYRARVFGSRLTLRLLLRFAALGALLERCARDAAWRAEVVAAGRARVAEHYTHDRVAERLVAFWRGVLRR